MFFESWDQYRLFLHSRFCLAWGIAKQGHSIKFSYTKVNKAPVAFRNVLP
jgi:hypothetical protein